MLELLRSADKILSYPLGELDNGDEIANAEPKAHFSTLLALQPGRLNVEWQEPL